MSDAAIADTEELTLGGEVIYRVFFTAIVVFAGCIRFARLNHSSFWLDEIMQSYFIHGTWAQFWHSLHFDAVHPPLDYLIDRLAENFKPSDAGRRILPALWGTASVAALASLVTRRAGRPAGLVSGLLLAVAPFHVRYSQEFRPYSLGVFTLLLSLLSLIWWLERPGRLRMCVLYVACLATAYTLYFSAIALAIASAGLLIEDALTGDSERRRIARRFLAWSPLFVGLLWVGYLPWLPVVREAARRAPFTAPPEMSLARLTRVLGFYSFAPNEGYPLGYTGIAYIGLVIIGVVIAFKQRRLRFFAIWVVATGTVIEVLEHVHPHFFVARHFLPAAVTFPALAAVGITRLGRRNLLRGLIAGSVIIGAVVCDVRGLGVYFREGRPDWRPLAAYLRQQPSDERVVAENQYAQLCVAYYLIGPYFLRPTTTKGRSIVPLSGDPTPMAWLWRPGKRAWLILINAGNQSAAVKKWAEPYPSIPFPSAEGGAILKALPAERR